MRRVVVLLGVVGAALVAATGAGATDSGATLTGQVLTRGSGLGCVRAPCWVPAPRVAVTVMRRGLVVARATAGRDGRFRVLLAPGAYTLQAPGLLSFSRDGKRRVQLRPGQLLRLTLVVARGLLEPAPKPRPTPSPGTPALI